MKKQLIAFHLFLLGINALISFAYFFRDEYEVFAFWYLYSLALFGITLLLNSVNLIYFIRNTFLGSVGYLAMAVKVIDPNALFGHHMKMSQTVEIVCVMFLLTNIAIFSSQMGFSLFKIKYFNTTRINYVKNPKLLMQIVIVLLLLLGFYVNYMAGNIILFDIRQGKSPMPIGTMGIIANILFFSSIMLFYKRKHLFAKVDRMSLVLIIFSALMLFVMGNFLRGERLDALNGVIGFYFLWLVYNNKKPKIQIRSALFLTFLFLLMQLIGNNRSSAVLSFVNLIINMRRPDGIMLFQGTINDIATTFSGTIYLLKERHVEFLLGKGYFDYILRTPPEFLFPDRPKSLAFIFRDAGFTMGGGFFELAEAYMNFGIFGVVFMPFIISVLISYALKKFFSDRYSLKSSILLFAIMACLIRGFLYQSFVMYKSIVTAVIILLILSFLLKIVRHGLMTNTPLTEKEGVSEFPK
jgi:hypothetical protein